MSESGGRPSPDPNLLAPRLRRASLQSHEEEMPVSLSPQSVAFIIATRVDS